MITYHNLEDAVSRWARDRPDVRTLLVVGSRARENGPVDKYSDLDLVIYTTHPAAYDTDSDWIASFGEIWLSVRSRTGHGDREWLVLFAGGIKADFVIAQAIKDKELIETLEQSNYADVFRRGVRVLLDKSSATSSEEPHLSAPKSRNQFTGMQFELGVNRLILAMTRAAKFVRRGDLWRSQQQINVDVKQELLVLIEWHASLTRSADYDVWYAGRFIEKWADPRVVSSLPKLFAKYDGADLSEALTSTIELAEWLAAEIAISLDVTYPRPGQARALSWIRELLA